MWKQTQRDSKGSRSAGLSATEREFGEAVLEKGLKETSTASSSFLRHRWQLLLLVVVMVGMTLLLARPEFQEPTRNLIEPLNNRKITTETTAGSMPTVPSATPSLSQMMADSLPNSGVATLRTILEAGGIMPTPKNTLLAQQGTACVVPTAPSAPLSSPETPTATESQISLPASAILSTLARKTWFAPAAPVTTLSLNQMMKYAPSLRILPSYTTVSRAPAALSGSDGERGQRLSSQSPGQRTASITAPPAGRFSTSASWPPTPNLSQSQRPLSKVSTLSVPSAGLSTRSKSATAPTPTARRSRGLGITASEGSISNSTKVGIASFYGASYDARNLCAMTVYPRGTHIRVTNLANGKSVTAVVNDHGPHVPGRIVDLPRWKFAEIANPRDGLCHVQVEVLK